MKVLWNYLCVALVSMSLAGCGTGGADGLVAVTGTVTYEGSPLEDGTVGFAPVDPTVGQPANGKITNGKFTMLTSASSPGVVPGDYKVRIVSLDLDSVQGLPPGVAPNPNTPPPEPASLIPKKYGDPNTSGLTVTVSSGMSELNFELDSKE